MIVKKSFDRIELQSGKNGSIRSEIRKMGPICKTRKTVAVDLYQSSMKEDDIDLDLGKQLVQETSFGDDNECLWLTSPAPIPSSFFKDYRSSSSSHLFVDEWLISWLLTLESSYVYPDKGSNSGMNPDGGTSLAASRKTRITDIISQQDDRREQGLIAVKISHGSDASDSFFNNSDSVELSSFDRSWTPGGTIFDSSKSNQISDSERRSLLGSLLNLDGEDSKLIPDTELEMNYFSSGFPSPSCKSTIYNDSTSSTVTDERITYVTSQEETSTDSVDLENFRPDEPLFWPPDWKQDWNSEETWKCFSMSPRKYTTELGIPQDTSSKSVESKSPILKPGSERSCRRRLDFRSNSTAASKILELKQQAKNPTCQKKKNITPSRLRKSTKSSVKIGPIEMEDDVEEAEDGEDSMAESNRGLPEDEIISNEELPIESLVGLGEFDGHEGLDSEFNEDVFSLDESLQGS